MTSRNPIAGPHRQNLQTTDENWLVQMAKDCQFMTTTCLDAAALAGRLVSEGGVPYSIFRAWTWEPDPGDRTGDALKQYAREVYEQARSMVASSGNPSVLINVNCEQGHSPNRIRMYTEMMRLNAADSRGPIGLVFLSTFIGSIMTGNWGQPNEFEESHWQEFLKVADETRHLRLPNGSYAHILGVHNYTSQFWWIAANGGAERSRPINWQTGNSITIDWNLAQDHLGREYQGIRRALKYTWNNATRKWSPSANTPKRADGSFIEPPWFIWTETLFDAVDGVPVFANPIDHNSRPKGYHSLKTWWERTAFPEDKGHGHTEAKMEIGAWEHLCTEAVGDGYCIGWNGYTLGDTGTWESHNKARKEGTDGAVDPDMDYWNDMKAYRFNMPDHFFSAASVPPPQPIPFPPPTDASWKAATISPATAQAAHVRSQPFTSASSNGLISQPESGWIAPEDAFTASDGIWYPLRVKNDTLQGWSRGDVIRFTLTPEPEPPVMNVYDIPVTMRIVAESEEAAALMARYMQMSMDVRYRQLRYDAEMMKQLDQIQSVSIRSSFPLKEENT